MAIVFRLAVEIDDEKPLGPQIAQARSLCVPWKVLERATGLSRVYLWELLTQEPERVPKLPAVNKFVSAKRPAARTH